MFKKVYSEEKLDKPQLPMEDPDAVRTEDMKRLEHITKKVVHIIFRVLIVGLVLFLLALFFLILPITAMTLEPYSRWLPFQRWAVAFLSTAGTAGIALLTVIITDLLKRAFDFFKKSVYPKE